MDHVRSTPNHPQTQGKIERWHQTLKNRILLENYYLPGDLKASIGAFVERYNHHRYHESLGNLMPVHRLRLPPPDEPFQLAPTGPDPAPELPRHRWVFPAVDLSPECRALQRAGAENGCSNTADLAAGRGWNIADDLARPSKR